MSINTVCTGCGKSLSVADEHAGKRARCPACGQIYTVPLASPVTDLPNAAIVLPQSVATDASLAIGWEPGGAASGASMPGQMEPSQFWMRATDGSIYGPVDRENLNRWFQEGRVGMGYQIRQGELGSWQDAAGFRPQAPVNPYAVTAVSNFSQPSTGLHHYPKPDRGVIVLVMGILSFMICGAFGIAAVVMGRSALKDIQAGLANPSDKPLVQIGFWLGAINLVLHLIAIGGLLLMIAIGIISEAR